MIKNVIFDFGNVLARFDPRSIGQKYAENESDADTLMSVIFDGRWADYDGGRISYEDHLAGSLARLPERLHGAAVRLFENWHGDLEPMASTEALIKVLHSRGYGLYILSNAPVEFSSKAGKNYPITAMFDGAVYSAEIRMDKPHAPIYRYLLETYGLEPDECLFIDDKPENVEGARACGMHAEVYDGDGEKVLRKIEQSAGTGIVDRGLVAKRYFESGYNCAQAVLLSFGDLTGLDEKMGMKLASSFGGGMGRLREVCGTVSGMFMVLGMLHGYDATAPSAAEDKKAHYAHIQELAERFRRQVGSIVCREILSGHVAKETDKSKGAEDAQTRAMLSSDPTPTPRSAEYYQKRPCGELAALAARLLDDYLRELEAKKG